jgi:pyruvate dehydrogenase E2 component (dihydrolipoamide acetyltransferase)
VTRVIEVRVPDMGNFKDVAVIDVLVKPGDAIEPDTPLVTLETEKATMDVPSTVGGIVERVAVSKGGHVSAGDIVVAVRSEEADGAPAGDDTSERRDTPAAKAPPAAQAAAPAPAAEAQKESRPAAPAAPQRPQSAAPAASIPAPAEAPRPATGAPPLLDEPGFSHAHASPSVRHFARELGVDLAAVTGTGFKARITADDVKAFVKRTLSSGARAAPAAARGSALPTVPVIDFSQFGPTEVKPLGRIKRISAARLQASWVNLPHVTQFDEADITELEAVRNGLKAKAAQEGIKLTPLAFIMRACVKALQKFPEFNSSLDASGENLIFKKYLNLGFAADTPNGLLVPVVPQADHKDVYELARSLAELSEKARSGTLNVTQMQGGCFTISSLGGIGGTAFTPIINAPEVAILGVSRSTYRPVYRDDSFVPRLILPLSLSYDHRVIDGALAVRFTSYLTQVLADPPGLLEAVP